MKILFICIGNICRSPALHHLMKKKLEERGLASSIQVDSAAISNWNIGEGMSEGMRKASEKKGFFFDSHKAKRFTPEMSKEYDYIFVVTKEILDHLKEGVSPKEQKKILLVTTFSKKFEGKEIPDPYRGPEEGFDQVFDMIETIVEELIEKLATEV